MHLMAHAWRMHERKVCLPVIEGTGAKGRVRRREPTVGNTWNHVGVNRNLRSRSCLSGSSRDRSGTKILSGS